MSSTATIWAARQRTERPTDKLVLWAMADQPMPPGQFRCFATVATLCEFTGLNRKTVLASLARMRGQQIIDTGERRGATKQVIVWQLAIDTVPETGPIETVPETEQSQKRNSPVFPREGSQKRDTDPEREPENPSTATPSKGAREQRAKRLPDDWAPKPLTGISAQIVERFEPGRLERVLASFGDHHRGKGSRMVDWDAAWRTWLGNEEKFDKRNGRNGHRAHHHRDDDIHNPLVRAAVRSAAASDARDRGALDL